MLGKATRTHPQLLRRIPRRSKKTKQEIIEMIQRAGFDPVERDTVYNRVEHVAA
jgi:2-iminoacetate synthase ThiH